MHGWLVCCVACARTWCVVWWVGGGCGWGVNSDENYRLLLTCSIGVRCVDEAISVERVEQ
jgi:hypothetical protein